MTGSPGKLSGQVAVVTGAGGGLGRAYAMRLAALGARVAVSDVDLNSYTEFAETGSSTVAEITAQGGTAVGIEADVTDADAVQAMVDDVVSRWGRIDVLVANAGGAVATVTESDDLAASRPSAATVTAPLLATVVTRNLNGTVHTCTAVAPVMQARGSGRIVTVGSYFGSVADRSGYGAHYGAAKAAVAVYTRYLAQELGPAGITVNCIAPGFIATGRILQMTGGAGMATDEIALRRLGTPEDCANVIEFLCTDLSGYVTGAVIPVNGGWNPAAS